MSDSQIDDEWAATVDTDLTICPVCSAAVPRGSRPAHREWHEQLRKRVGTAGMFGIPLGGISDI